jgi:anti-sigma-K factor RskA
MPLSQAQHVVDYPSRDFSGLLGLSDQALMEEIKQTRANVRELVVMHNEQAATLENQGQVSQRHEFDIAQARTDVSELRGFRDASGLWLSALTVALILAVVALFVVALVQGLAIRRLRQSLLPLTSPRGNPHVGNAATASDR